MDTEDIISIGLVLGAAAICTFGVILLIKLTRNMEKERLDTWLGFIKFFLGTFVIGLLGFFAKLTFDNRAMAVTESEQIGKYVKEAMSEDLKARIRFAEYFSTVLPKGHNTQWDAYYDTLIERKKVYDSILGASKAETADLVDKEKDIKNLQDSLLKIRKRNDSLRKIGQIEDAIEEEKVRNLKKAIKDMVADYDSVYSHMEETSVKLNEESKLGVNGEAAGSASIKNPDDFVTCQSVENLMPVGRTSNFTVNRKVYVHAFINSPRKEEITIIWKGPDGGIINTMKSNIGINTGRGYRLYDHIRPKEEGENYSVTMQNEAGETIAYKTFRVR